MPVPSIYSCAVSARQPSRLGVLALTALLLVTACATGRPMSEGTTVYRYSPPMSRDSLETWAQETVEEEEDTGEDEAVFATLPTNFAPVQVGNIEFTGALTTFWLNIPLRVATCTSSVVRRSQTSTGVIPLVSGWRDVAIRPGALLWTLLRTVRHTGRLPDTFRRRAPRARR